MRKIIHKLAAEIGKRPSLALAILCCLYFLGPLLSFDQILFYEDSDLVWYFSAGRRAIVGAIEAGGLPLWDATYMSGTPTFSDIQAQLFYPPTIIQYFVPQHYAWTLFIVGHFAWAAIGAYRFVELDVEAPVAGIVCAIGFVFSGFAYAHGTAGLSMVPSASWIPWVLLYVKNSWSQGGIRNSSLLAICFSLQFLAGFPQYTLFTVYLAAFLVISDLVHAYRTSGGGGIKESMPKCLTYLGAGILAAGMISIQLLPSLEYGQYSTRAGGVSEHFAIVMSLPFKQFVGLFMPEALGTNVQAYDIPGINYQEATFYPGHLASMLAIIGLALPFRKRFGLFMGVAAVGSLLFATGKYLPFYAVLLKYAPGFNMVAGPVRFVVVFNFVVAVLAAYGVSALLCEKRLFVKRLNLCVIGYVVAAIVTVFLMTKGLGDWKFWLTLSASMVAIVLASRNRGAWIWIVPLVLLGDLSLYGWKYGQNRQPAAVVFQKPAVAAFLEMRPDSGRVMADFYPQYLAVESELEVIHGYNPLILARYFRYFRAIQNEWGKVEGRELIMQRLSNVGLLDLLNVQHVVSRAPIDWPQRFAPVHKATDGTNVYENLEAMPRAYAVGQARYVEPDELLRALVADDFEMRKEVLVEDQKEALDGEAFFVPCTVVERRSDRIVVEAVLPHGGIMALSEVHYPGWQVTVNGEAAEMLRCNYLFRGVKLPAGKHEVIFELRPKSLIVGAWVSLVAWLIGGIMLVLPIRRGVLGDSDSRGDDSSCEPVIETA